MEAIFTNLISMIVLIGVGYIVYQQNLEQDRKYERRLAEKNARKEAKAK